MFRAVVGIIPSFIFFLLSVFAQDGLRNPERLWTDSSGRFQVTARLLSQKGKQIVLENSDGKKIAINRDQLSEADQAFLNSLETDPKNPFKAPPTGSKPAVHEKPVEPKPSLDAARRLDDAKDLWRVEVSRAERPNIKPSDIDLPRPQGSRQPHAVNGLLMKVAISDVSGTGPSARTRLMIGDFRTGKLTEFPPQTETAMHPVAILGDGSTIIMVGNGSDRTTSSTDLQAWQTNNGSLMRGPTWTPYEGQPNPAIRFAAAGPDNSLITCSKGGHIVAWEMPGERAMWQLEMGSPPYWHTTYDQRRLAIASATQLVIVDLPEGKVVGSHPLRDLGSIHYPKLSFNPSEDKLYLSSIGRVLILDLRSNQWVQDANVSGVGTSRGAIFCDDEYVLIDGSSLVDWKNGTKVAQYSGFGAPLQAGHFTFVVSDSQMRALDMPIDLKAPAAATAMEETNPGKQASDLVGRWQIAAVDEYGSGNQGRTRSTYRFGPDGTYEVYSTLTVVNKATSEQVYSVTSREQGTWTQRGKEICLTEEKSELINFMSATAEVTRKTFEAAIAEKTPPMNYTIVSPVGKTIKLRDSQGRGTMLLQRVD